MRPPSASKRQGTRVNYDAIAFVSLPRRRSHRAQMSICARWPHMTTTEETAGRIKLDLGLSRCYGPSISGGVRGGPMPRTLSRPPSSSGPRPCASRGAAPSRSPCWPPLWASRPRRCAGPPPMRAGGGPAHYIRAHCGVSAIAPIDRRMRADAPARSCWMRTRAGGRPGDGRPPALGAHLFQSCPRWGGQVIVAMVHRRAVRCPCQWASLTPRRPAAPAGPRRARRPGRRAHGRPRTAAGRSGSW